MVKALKALYHRIRTSATMSSAWPAFKTIVVAVNRRQFPWMRWMEFRRALAPAAIPRVLHGAQQTHWRCNVSCCDGSVHFISDGINICVWRALCSAAGGANAGETSASGAF